MKAAQCGQFQPGDGRICDIRERENTLRPLCWTESEFQRAELSIETNMAPPAVTNTGCLILAPRALKNRDFKGSRTKRIVGHNITGGMNAILTRNIATSPLIKIVFFPPLMCNVLIAVYAIKK